MTTDAGVDALIEEARRVGRHRRKKEALTAALKDYIRTRKQLQALELMGTIEKDPDYDYKKERGRKRMGRLKLK